MNSLTLAFSQMTASGRLMGQDLLQMINAGFNPLSEISRKTGKSIGVLKEEMEKGKISAEMVTQAFYSATQAGGQFHGMTEKMGQTAAGKWSTLLGLAGDLLFRLYGIIEPLVIPAMTALEWIVGLAGKGIDALGAAIGWVSEFMQRHATVVAVLGTALGILATSMFLVTLQSKAMAAWAGIVTTAKWAWAAAQNGLNLALLACPVTWIIAAVIGLIAVIGYVCYKVQGWGTLWDGTVGFMKHSFLGFVESVKLYFSTMINGLMIGLDKIKLGWYKFKEAVGLGDSAENQAAIARINADIENRQQAIIEGAKRVADHAAKARASLDIGFEPSGERALVAGIGPHLQLFVGPLFERFPIRNTRQFECKLVAARRTAFDTDRLAFGIGSLDDSQKLPLRCVPVLEVGLLDVHGEVVNDLLSDLGVLRMDVQGFSAQVDVGLRFALHLAQHVVPRRCMDGEVIIREIVIACHFIFSDLFGDRGQ